MSETTNLKLPLVAAAQAQKHVTVNEALARVDAALQMNIVSRTLMSPPTSTLGEVYLVPDAALGDWTGQDGALAFAVGNGWDFIPPQAGWRIWVADESKWISFGVSGWLDGAIATTQSGAGLRIEVLEFDNDFVGAATEIQTTAIIPAGSVVFAVTGRVLDGFDGSLSNWSLGVTGSSDRYGSGLGTATAAYVRGLTGQPQSYYSDTPLVLTANGGDFGSGEIRLAIHLMHFELPNL
jgi:hypothetical protein